MTEWEVSFRTKSAPAVDLLAVTGSGLYENPGSVALLELGYNIRMDVILTHEQADFDALGSLLAAYLLENYRRDPAAVAVIPRRLNRNARTFMALYAGELPFSDPRELPSEAVDHVLLVDTQALITLKGMGAHTAVRVIDHHPARPDAPAGWSLAIEPSVAPGCHPRPNF